VAVQPSLPNRALVLILEVKTSTKAISFSFEIIPVFIFFPLFNKLDKISWREDN